MIKIVSHQGYQQDPVRRYEGFTSTQVFLPFLFCFSLLLFKSSLQHSGSHARYAFCEVAKTESEKLNQQAKPERGSRGQPDEETLLFALFT